MKIFKNLLTPEQVQHFKDYWKNNSDKIYVNWTDGDQLIDRRLHIHADSDEYKQIDQIVRKEFPEYKGMWGGLQEQTFPHNIHIDDYCVRKFADKEKTENRIWTYIFALDTVPEFKTIVWEETAFSNDEFHHWVKNWGATKQIENKKTNISQTEDLEHTFDQNQNDYMADYLTLSGVFTYSTGDAAVFNAKQFHCTSNWTKYPQHKSRFLLQLHLMTD